MNQLYLVTGQISVIIRENPFSKPILGKLGMNPSDMGLAPTYSLDNSLQDDMHVVASSTLSSPHIAWEADRSRLPHSGSGGRVATTALGN